jgi:Mrp family chromosome partitioning ATPase
VTTRRRPQRPRTNPQPTQRFIHPARRGDNSSAFFLPTYDDFQPELMEAVRNLVNRYELRMEAPLETAIAVTAASEDADGTLASQALATVLALEIDRFVCWFDLSWIDRNAAAEVLGTADLLELLADHSQIGTAFGQSPENERLITLSFGPVPDDKRNLIVRSPAFEELFQIVTDEFDHVILNMPPILGSTNSVAALRHADLSLVVARHRSTTVAEVERSIDNTEPTTNLGVIVTDYRPRVPHLFRRWLTT